ncbi:MAG: hypothetical protein FMNOHCHN_02051 [Ignavibacteriaceae bacterium]|nr:hypothetical protein [Ignavibacteriaceae bacterium]
MQNPFKTLKQTYEMSIKPLTEAYEKSLEEEQQKFLKGVAEFFGAESIKFHGGEEYNDEEYYDDLMDLYIDDESVQDNFQLGTRVYEKLFGEKSPHKEDGKYGPETWEQWKDIKDELINQMPEFIKTKTTSYDSNQSPK